MTVCFLTINATIILQFFMLSQAKHNNESIHFSRLRSKYLSHTSKNYPLAP